MSSGIAAAPARRPVSSLWIRSLKAPTLPANNHPVKTLVPAPADTPVAQTDAPAPTGALAASTAATVVQAAEPPVSKPDASGVPGLSTEARERIRAAPKKRKIALVSDTADALRRVEVGETVKRPAPAPSRESASGYVPPPTQSNGTTPAARAMRRAQVANAALMVSQYNIVKHFVVLDKLLQQATVGAVVAETALDLARSGNF